MKTKSLTGLGVTLGLLCGAQAVMAAPTSDAPSAHAVINAASASLSVSFRIFLPLRNQAELDSLLSDLHEPSSPKYQQWLTPDEFNARFGPSKADLATLKKSMESHGFTILSEDAHGIRVEGTAKAVSQAFSVPVQTKTQYGHTRPMTRGTVRLPAEIASLNARVVGLDGIPQRQVHSHKVGPVEQQASKQDGAGSDAQLDNRESIVGPYWFTDLKQAYDYPAYEHGKTDGTGVTAAVLMEDLVYPGDLPALFNHEKFEKITGLPAPKVTTVKIDGGGVVGGDGTDEASLDVQMILGGAPGSKVTLVSVPDLSDDHLLDGYAYIVDKNAYDLVNSSFGGCELTYDADYNEGTDFTYILDEYHELFKQGNAQGITFVASSGDEGALECPDIDYLYGISPAYWQIGVSNPASDTSVTAVGGGNLVTTYKKGSLNSAYVSENGYGDTEIPYDAYGLGIDVIGGYWGAGGGVSPLNSKPAYQSLAITGSFTQRTLPDVGMQVGGCPGGISDVCNKNDSAVVVAVGVGEPDGGFFGFIGTSISSPEFVGALALFEQSKGKNHRQGNVNYYLYAKGVEQTLFGGPKAPSPLQYYHRGIPGYDGYYHGGYPSANYDYIYGQGSPDVRNLFSLTQYPAAGVPQTKTNP
jgi:subtilase family serine protease